MTPNIYLDFDGVLLANDLYPADSAAEFIHYVLTRFPAPIELAKDKAVTTQQKFETK